MTDPRDIDLCEECRKPDKLDSEGRCPSCAAEHAAEKADFERKRIKENTTQ